MKKILISLMFVSVLAFSFNLYSDGCEKDTDCKGERICVKGECTPPRDRLGDNKIDKQTESNVKPLSFESPPPAGHRASNIENFESEGNYFKKTGRGLLIPGVILTAYGLVGMLTGPFMYSYDYSDENEDRLAGWSDDSIGPSLVLTGVASFVVGVPMLVTGAVLFDLGKRKLNKLESGKKYSLNIIPVVSPGTKTYGALLSLCY